MKKQKIAICAVLGLMFAWASLLQTGAEPLHSVPFSDVGLADAFWAPRIETNRVVTIPHLLRQLERQGSLGGFRVLAGNSGENYHGRLHADSDVYKTLEGIIASLRLSPDPALEQQMERIIMSIAAAQAPDGYISPHLQITEANYRHFSEETNRTCESYGMGHLIEAAVEHYQLTRRTNFLSVAIKTAELLCRTQAGGELLQVSGHPEVELALVKLYHATGDPAWLKLASSMVQSAQRLSVRWSQGSPALAGDNAHGHAVAMLYLYSAATDLAQIQSDVVLADLMRRKWTNIVGRKLYLTGGMGHLRYREGFAPDYDLSNDLAYCETCAAIANVFWQHRLFLATGEAMYIDVLERSLYNNALAGLSLAGDRFFYMNPLVTDGKRKLSTRLPERFAWTDCPCCPVNLVRLIPRVGGYCYAVRDNDIWVNLYVTGRVNIRLANGQIGLRQETRYPWDGMVRIEITSAPSREIGLRLRIPGWARGLPVPTDLYRYANPGGEPVKLLVNGSAVPLAEQQGYAILRRAWKTGDRVEMVLPMPVRRVLAHEKVVADAGCVALERGPLVYCVEGADHNGQVLNLVMPDDANLTSVRNSDSLGGITLIETMGQCISKDRRRTDPVPLKFIPYYAWNHRGTGPMTVWLPRTALRLPKTAEVGPL